MAQHPAGKFQRGIAIIGIGGGKRLGQQVAREGGDGGLLELADQLARRIQPGETFLISADIRALAGGLGV